MKTQKISALLIAVTMILSLSTTVFADNVSQIIGNNNTVVFVDVPSDYWAKDQIEYFANQGIVNGYEDGSFQPEAGVTREEFCKLLVSTFKAPLETPDSPSFADVSANRWSYPYVEICKDFLTGYANPFGGLPSFHPEEYATREDIAVALVRMMGYIDSDANDKNYVDRKFKDSGNISPNLKAYVSIACEKGLISGYPDGTFGPLKGITRAETVVLLNRATKHAVTNINAELELSANVIYSKNGKTATVNILTEAGTTVTVNGESVKMSGTYEGMYEGSFVYEFKEPGTKTFTVEGIKSGKSKIVKVTAEYEHHGPKITISEIPETVNTKELSLSGTVTSTNNSNIYGYYDKITLTVNGEKVYVSSYDNSWSKTIDLKDGNNTITLIATNSAGESTTVVKTVKYVDNGPVITIKNCPKSSEKASVTISGTVEDVNYSKYDLELTINGEEVYISYDGDWSETVQLKVGENTFKIVAENADGKQAVITKTITFDYGAPELTITSCPEKSDTNEVKIYGLVSDVNDRPYSLEVFVDGKEAYVGYDGKWNQTVKLTEGKNVVKIVAVNSLGKRTEVVKTISYGDAEPILQIKECPSHVTNNKVTISGTIQYESGTAELKINGKSIAMVSSGDGQKKWSKTFELNMGENEFVFVLESSTGKSTTAEKTINFTAEGPELTFINCPKTVTTNKVTVKGKFKNTENGAYLFVNGNEVSVDSQGLFSVELSLDEGENEFSFKAVNNHEMETTVEKVIIYTIEEDEIETSETQDYDYEKICNYCKQNDGTITLTLKKGVKTDVKWTCSSCEKENLNHVTHNW